MTGTSLFHKSSLPCLWSFLFGIVLWCLIGHSSGVNKEILEVYDFLVGIYYDLNVGYATQLWEEFSTAITHTNLANGVSYARYWSLISSKFMKKEGILVHSEDEKADFSTLATPQLLVDDPVIFQLLLELQMQC